VATYLKRLKETHSSFDFQRQYDARSAGGRFHSQAGDYLIWNLCGLPGIGGHCSCVLEVKTVHHDFRLPSKNFNGEQIGKLRRRRMTGSDIVILIFHSTSEMWSVPNFHIFASNPTAPSWDLSAIPRFEKAATALATTFPHLFPGT